MAIDVALEDRALVVAVLGETLDLGALDRHARSSLSMPRRENTRTSTTVPVTPGGTLSEVSRTSAAFSPKIARSSFSSGVIGVSPLA